MGTLLFGKQESLSCIVDVPVRGRGGEELCLGFKTSSYFVGGGVYLRDDGYVFRVKGTSDRYIPVSAEELTELQQSGSLPTPLPPYSVPLFEYAFGYSLWIILAVMAIFGAVRSVASKRRRAEDARTPISLGPPELRTKADRFVADQVRPLLRFGEQVQHQGYALDAVPTGSVVDAARAKASYVILTNQRMLIVKTRVGAFGPLLENLGVEAIERRAILGVDVAERMLTVHVDQGPSKAVWVAPTRKLSNQRAFLRDVPRILAVQEEPTGEAAFATGT